MKNIFRAVLFLSLVLSCADKSNNAPDDIQGDEIEKQLEKFNARKRYSFFTAGILASISDTEIEQAIVDYVDDMIIRGDSIKNLPRFKKLSPGFRAVYSTLVLEEEVNSGGFVQYFYYTKGLFADEAIEGFKLIGATALSDTCRSADAVFLSEKKRGMVRYDSKDSFMTDNAEDNLGRLDDEFSRESVNVSGLRREYIRKNTAQFITR